MTTSNRRPAPCPKCGHMNGWKNFKCKGAGCGAALRELRESVLRETHVAVCSQCRKALADRPLDSLSQEELERALDGAPDFVRAFVADKKNDVVLNACECAVSFTPLAGDRHRPVYGRSGGRWGVSRFCDCHQSGPFNA